MSEITRTQLKEIKADVDDALKGVALKFGLEDLVCGRISYNAENFSIKVVGRLEGARTKEEAKYDSMREALKLPARNSRFMIADKTYQILGMTSRNSIIAEWANRRYRVSVQQLKEVVG